MNNSYTDLVTQTFNFPQEGFETKDNNLFFNGLDIKALIDKYGTPMKLTYLPKIGMQIKRPRRCLPMPLKSIGMKGSTIIVIVPRAPTFLSW
ncbi:hypothetical protein [Paraflavitalea speifideaquila]|uniref:hypothetical protein n=1 Tax=Paraflavitalea speifideaquila TaxID=3076558 RepID=UPI0028EB13DB|nr:hypothetical protein [Paraflavitalea speifideiaquila]